MDYTSLFLITIEKASLCEKNTLKQVEFVIKLIELVILEGGSIYEANRRSWWRIRWYFDS